MVVRSLAAMLLLLSLCVACNREERVSSHSIDDARARGVLMAEYAIAEGVKLGDYTPLEVWIEDEGTLVVRLKGPHVDAEPRVQIQGLNHLDYRCVWSERNGWPYEIWLAPDPIPETLELKRGQQATIVRRRNERHRLGSDGASNGSL